MLKQLLKHFPKNAYPLTLVHDPDGLLEDESVLTALGKLGFRFLFEPNPIHLRYQVEKIMPFSKENQVIIRSEKPLNELPYDLWMQGQHVQLSLNNFFPNFSYPVVQQLTLSQIGDLGRVSQPTRRLGHDGTIKLILKEVFGIDVNQSGQPDYFLFWLSEYHRQIEPMANIFFEFLISHLEATPGYSDWPAVEMISNKDKYIDVLQELWGDYVEKMSGKQMGEPKAPYHVNFEESDLLQTQLAKLVQSGYIEPVRVAESEDLPYWIKPGVIAEAENLDLRRFEQLHEVIKTYDPAGFVNYHWEEWQQLALKWADFTTLRYKPSLKLTKDQKEFFRKKQEEIDAGFLIWLKEKYSYWAGRQLPIPHHLYHIPHYLTYERSKNNINQFALLVLDGMALADWKIIHSAWQVRHKDWKFEEKLLLAQVPTITAISRQALVSGMRPIEFADYIKDNRQEPKWWTSFWEEQQIASSDIIYDRLVKDTTGWKPSWIGKPRLQIVCMIKNNLDDMIHSAVHGAKGFYADLEFWLNGDSIGLEEILEQLLNQGFSIFVVSDHGHIEATGFGKITDEGLTVETRAKRARIYNNINFALQNKEKLMPSILWHDDNLLPEETWVLMPEQCHAFVSEGETVLAHGGISLEEVIVPFVKIEK
ncbi:BREX-3 system phosphatase PglZ [Chloroflexota bacterium]